MVFAIFLLDIIGYEYDTCYIIILPMAQDDDVTCMWIKVWLKLHDKVDMHASSPAFSIVIKIIVSI